MKVKELAKLRLSEEQNRRIKITSDIKSEIVKEYQTGMYSYLDLAKKYNVSKSTIACTVNPTALERQRKRNREYIKTHPMDIEKRREQGRKQWHSICKYKKELYEKGELK